MNEIVIICFSVSIVVAHVLGIWMSYRVNMLEKRIRGIESRLMQAEIK
jgi:hypothetical protein